MAWNYLFIHNSKVHCQFKLIELLNINVRRTWLQDGPSCWQNLDPTCFGWSPFLRHDPIQDIKISTPEIISLMDTTNLMHVCKPQGSYFLVNNTNQHLKWQFLSLPWFPSWTKVSSLECLTPNLQYLDSNYWYSWALIILTRSSRSMQKVQKIKIMNINESSVNNYGTILASWQAQFIENIILEHQNLL